MVNLILLRFRIDVSDHLALKTLPDTPDVHIVV